MTGKRVSNPPAGLGTTRSFKDVNRSMTNTVDERYEKRNDKKYINLNSTLKQQLC